MIEKRKGRYREREWILPIVKRFDPLLRRKLHPLGLASAAEIARGARLHGRLEHRRTLGNAGRPAFQTLLVLKLRTSPLHLLPPKKKPKAPGRSSCGSVTPMMPVAPGSRRSATRPWVASIQLVFPGETSARTEPIAWGSSVVQRSPFLPAFARRPTGVALFFPRKHLRRRFRHPAGPHHTSCSPEPRR